MKLRHKINHGWAPDHTDPEWAERVEREAELTTEQADRRYQAAIKRWDKARQRVEREQSRKTPDRRLLRRLEAALEARLAEIRELERLMRQSPAGSQHRGKGSYRGIAQGEP